MTHAPLTFRLRLTSILSLAAAQANAACYTVYDAAGRAVTRPMRRRPAQPKPAPCPRVAVSC